MKRLLVVISALLLTLALASPAVAQATSYTQTFHDVTEVMVDVIPCTGAPATITITYNGVAHINSLPGGEFWATFTETGKVSLTDANGVSYSGHFTVWGGFNLNERNTNSTFTLTVRLAGSDGSTIVAHEVQHFALNANGTVTVNFDRMRLTCG